MHPIEIVDAARIARLGAAAAASPRARMNDNLHAMEDPVHRLLNAIEPGSYVQPHRHRTAPRRETLAVLRGAGAVVIFDDEGRIERSVRLTPEGPVHVIEVPSGCWHSLVSLEPGTVFFEVKEGPYVAIPPEDLAPWAPAPGDPAAAAYLEELRAAAQAA